MNYLLGRRNCFSAFVFLIISLVFSFSAFAECQKLPQQESVRVVYVYDGDTVKLSDDRRIRLIGINTPEMNHGKSKPDSYALEAKNLLQRLVLDKMVHLSWDREKKDRYGRYLAYLSLADGTDVQAELVKHGLAMSIVVPPNDSQLSCYRQHEKQAKTARKGLWNLKNNQYKELAEIKHWAKGYYFIEAVIIKAKKLKRGVKFWLSDRVSIYIQDKIISNEDLNHLSLWQGKKIRFRGWMKKYRGKPQFKLAHILNIQRLE